MKLTRNTIKSKFIYDGCQIVFHGAGSWSFDSNFAGNVAVAGVDKVVHQ